MRHRRSIVAAVLFSTATLAASAHASPTPPPPDARVGKELLALRAKLRDVPEDQALAQKATFRPLCDAHGYPLVGNLATKGPSLQPSAFCRAVRLSEGGEP